jgi:hypothetical protein
VPEGNSECGLAVVLKNDIAVDAVEGIVVDAAE